jgi:tripartite-type tricarboxylate transporter receptor subunit TctC
VTDLVSRRIAADVGAALGATIVPDNRPGSNGVPAVTSLKGTPPDGYTLFVGFLGTHATNASMYQNLAYDPVGEFTPIGLLVDAPAIVSIYPGLPIKTLDELVAYARKNPGKLNFGVTGIGGAGHLVLEMLKQHANIDIVAVPYKGTAQLLPDLFTGTIDGYFDVYPTAAPNIQAGKVRPLVVTAQERLPQLPDLPTAREAGFDLIFSTWFGLYAYGTIPDPARERLVTTLRDVLAQPAFKQWCQDKGLRSLGGGPDDLARFAADETRRLGAVIRSANIRPE